MNFGTKLRTILVIATSINTALMATDISSFNNPTLDLVYKALTLAVNFVVVAVGFWYNNDYTEAGVAGTELTRALKAELSAFELGDNGTAPDNEVVND